MSNVPDTNLLDITFKWNRSWKGKFEFTTDKRQLEDDSNTVVTNKNKSSRELMKEMLSERRNKKTTKK